MTKIYFAGSIRGGREMAMDYQRLISLLQTMGHVYTEHVGDEKALEKDEETLSDKEIHDRDMEWIRKSDIMIAEVSVPSLGVGYEIASAINLRKPVLCLCHARAEKRISAMIAGSSDLRVLKYNSFNEVESAIISFISDPEALKL